MRGTQPNERGGIASGRMPVQETLQRSSVSDYSSSTALSPTFSVGLVVGYILVCLLVAIIPALLGFWGCKRQEKKFMAQGIEFPKISWFWINLVPAFIYTLLVLILIFVIFLGNFGLDFLARISLVQYMPAVL